MTHYFLFAIKSMQTGVPSGTYQELVTCADVTVGADGTAMITITNEEEPIFAICQGCVCDDAPTVTATHGPGKKNPSW